MKAPVSAFLTFNTALGADQAQDILSEELPDGTFPKLFGEHVRVEMAGDPSDIKWENKQVRFGRLVQNTVVFTIAMMIVLGGSYYRGIFPLL